MLKQFVCLSRPQIADRYYQALYSKIFDREMVSSNKHVSVWKYNFKFY